MNIRPVSLRFAFNSLVGAMPAGSPDRFGVGSTIATAWRSQAENLNTAIARCNEMTDAGAHGDVYGMAIGEVERQAAVFAIAVEMVEAWFDHFAPETDTPDGLAWSSEDDHDEVTGLWGKVDADGVAAQLFSVMAPGARW